jgi:hypothetical protein
MSQYDVRSDHHTLTERRCWKFLVYYHGPINGLNGTLKVPKLLRIGPMAI